jgi:hypothetical protein
MNIDTASSDDEDLLLTYADYLVALHAYYEDSTNQLPMPKLKNYHLIHNFNEYSRIHQELRRLYISGHGHHSRVRKIKNSLFESHEYELFKAFRDRDWEKTKHWLRLGPSMKNDDYNELTQYAPLELKDVVRRARADGLRDVFLFISGLLKAKLWSAAFDNLNELENTLDFLPEIIALDDTTGPYGTIDGTPLDVWKRYIQPHFIEANFSTPLIKIYAERFNSFFRMLIRATPPPIPYEHSRIVAMALHHKSEKSLLAKLPPDVLVSHILNGRVWPPK